MAPPGFRLWPLKTEAFGNENRKCATDVLPATYHYHATPGKRAVGDPAEDVPAFLQSELSLGGLPGLLKHLWFAGAARPAMPLHLHVARGREIVVLDQMHMHLLSTNDSEGRLFVKPVPRFLLSLKFCQENLQCPPGCPCPDPPVTTTCRGIPRSVALGFLYTYACLISSKTDFHLANEKRLLPRNDHNDEPISWPSWKTLARELLHTHAHDPSIFHPRFHRAELRLSRLNTISRLITSRPYARSHHSYGNFFRHNLAWTAAATVFVALVLTAMQVGLATDRLQEDPAFQRASYGFTVFAILAPLGVFGLMVLRALFHLARDMPLLLGWGGRRKRAAAVGAAPVFDAKLTAAVTVVGKQPEP
ncbi:hypothetical protein C8A05DRAFT_19295 [Staphylotrichum tortipilum]|uniref:Uncharacterized protein n=1 Tax=Staphylotrichum tortipilum TaxID=2831512 RepID=A0AAN6RPV0_9PEZI|nr:hypothetical protein C8A05DRAFT_19295 [Staphylotrichum longicolle]